MNRLKVTLYLSKFASFVRSFGYVAHFSAKSMPVDSFNKLECEYEALAAL